MFKKPVNSIDAQANTIKVNDNTSSLKMIFKDDNGQAIDMAGKIDYFRITKDKKGYYEVTDYTTEGDAVLFRLPDVPKGHYYVEVRDTNGQLYPADRDVVIEVRWSMHEGEQAYYNSYKDAVLNDVEPIIVTHMTDNVELYKGEKGEKGNPGPVGPVGPEDNTSQERIQERYRNGNKNTIVTFIDDDGTQEFIDRLKPIFDSENVPCTLPVNPGAFGLETTNTRRLESHELLALQDEGYEIISHGYDHLAMDRDQTDEDLDFDLGEAKRILKEQGFKGYRFYAYANSVRPDDYRTQGFVRKYYECGIATSMSHKNTVPLEQFKIARVGANQDYATMKSIIDGAENEWIILMSHAWQPAFETVEQQENIRNIIQYIKSQNIDIVTVEEGLNRFGNIIDYQTSETEYLKITKTGELSNSPTEETSDPVQSPKAFVPDSPIPNSDIDKPGNEYPVGITVRAHPSNHTDNAPVTGRAGISVTYRAHTSDNYITQEWTTNNGLKFFRWWNFSGNVWLDWTQL